MIRRPVTVATRRGATEDSSPPAPVGQQPARGDAGRSKRSRGTALEVVILVVVVLAALALRLPFLQTIPAFSDELDEVQLALGMLRGEPIPLTNITTRIGALFNYLVAGAFALFGPQVIVPRALVMVFGTLTVPAAYLLGRQAGGPVAGTVAAALLATSGTHILVNSHIALSSSLTPFFVTVGVWLVGRAVTRRHPASLVLAGLALGLALQTHPTVIAVLAGSGLFLLVRAPRLVWGWHGAAAGAAFLLGYGNMVAYNLMTGFESFSSALEASSDYQQGQVEQPPGYAVGLRNILLAMIRLLAGRIDLPLRADALVFDPLVAIYSVLVVGGLVLAARRGLGLWLLVVAFWLLLLPAFNWKYGSLVVTRWLNPIAPLCYAGVGCALAVVWSQIGSAPRLSGAGAWLSRALLALPALGLVLAPVWPLQRHYVETSRRGPTNAEPLRQAALLSSNRRPDERVVIDATLQRYELEPGGSVSKALRYALTIDRVPLVRLAVTEERLAETVGAAPSILLATDRRRANELQDRFQLTPLDPAWPDNRGLEYGAYRVTTR